MERNVKNSITGQLKAAENFYRGELVTRNLKTVTQADHVGIDADITTLYVGVG